MNSERFFYIFVKDTNTKHNEKVTAYMLCHHYAM